MNEQLARDVILVRAIETMDDKREILSDDDRMYASRSARELAQWQAAESKSAVTTEHFLQQRSEQILKRLAERTPALNTFLAGRGALRGLAIALPLVALLLGAGLDRIGDPHRVDLLSAPLLGILGWNLLVYASLIAWMFVPAPRKLLARLTAGKAKLPRKLPPGLAAALTEFTLQWNTLSARLNGARLGRTLHLSAAMFALGATLSLYARGLLTEYRAGWESTFLDAGQVHAILAVVFAPAMSLLPLQGFTLAEIEALRFSLAPSSAGGARWVHLYAATLLLVVVVPRLVLAAVDHWRARRMARNFPLDMGQPYFHKLGDQAGVSGPALLRVLPYSFTVDEARDKGLGQLAITLFGEQARVMLRPMSGYGEDAPESLREVALDDPAITCTAVLFNLAATPEKENHGAFLDYLVRHSPRGIAVLVDQSSLAERSDAVRLAERAALWQQFCSYHGAPATIVDLLNPQQQQVDAGLPLSKAS